MEAPIDEQRWVLVRSSRPAALRRPALFQLRHHFVLKERIGIEEIGAEQVLTKRACAPIRSRRIVRRRCIGRFRSRRRNLRHRRLAFAQARMPIVPEHFRDLGEKPARIHVALPRLTAYGGDEDETVRSITLSRYDTSDGIAAGRRNMFCIRLHFCSRRTNPSRKNQRESIPRSMKARGRNLLSGALAGTIFGGRNFETTANTDDHLAAEVRIESYWRKSPSSAWRIAGMSCRPNAGWHIRSFLKHQRRMPAPQRLPPRRASKCSPRRRLRQPSDQARAVGLRPRLPCARCRRRPPAQVRPPASLCSSPRSIPGSGCGALPRPGPRVPGLRSSFQSLIISRCFSTVASHLPSGS